MPERSNIGLTLLKCGFKDGNFHPCCTILENISEGVIAIDLDKKITFFNKAAESLTGFSSQDALGQYCFDIFRANICAERCPMDQVLKGENQPRDVPAFIINKSGDQVPISVSSCGLRADGGELIGVIEIFRDLSELERLRRQVARTYSPEDIVGRHPKMREIFAFLPDIAESDSPVLIEGPTGSGKELFARAIHTLSTRRNGPFVAINCGALPDTLLESELFGYTKGAFTGATRDKPGRFLLADKGTLFLDEICNTSLAFQADLLRALEEGEFTPLGHTKSLKADIRVVAATNRNLKQMVKEGTFREDLYYRLNVVRINLPPLRERKEDIPLLVEHFIHKYNLLKGRAIMGVSQEVMALLLIYPFPGNIRELENIIEYSYILCKGPTINVEHLPSDVREWATAHPITRPPRGSLAMQEATRIQEALEKCGGNRIAAAKELGISRTTLWRKIKKYGLD
ncbi:MAG: sigma 54-interacting transcriptional regulator [Deltaproteobacteria bacterium]|nr:sigma 54-interacting transcriptional regulator [Deltaproteobacteria bacterium]